MTKKVNYRYFQKKDPFKYFRHIVLIEGRTKIKKDRFWPYFCHIVLIEGVLIDANRSKLCCITRFIYIQTYRDALIPFFGYGIILHILVFEQIQFLFDLKLKILTLV
jgi:hypothetical protein